VSLRIYGNRLLKTLPGLAIRPTPSRVREAVFNVWQGKIAGCRWLDLCAGSGSMGAEALCRGAASALAIEQSRQSITIIEHNWQQVATEGQTFQIIRGDVVKKLPQLASQQFDRIYFDPPYASELYLPVLQAIAQNQLLASTGELAVEYDPKIFQLPEIEGLEICRDKVYGKTAIAFYRTTLKGKDIG
jgi:16S rRNA (guanine966-N2)-methyltransferase